MKNVLLWLGWWLIPAAVGYGHFYSVPWMFNVGLAGCVILMLLSLFAASCLLSATVIPGAAPSTKEIKAIREGWTRKRRAYSLVQLAVMVVLFASAGFVFTAVAYFVVTMISWLSVHLLSSTVKHRQSSHFI
jgi:hypothetical protein